VADVWVDRGEPQIRYLEVSVTGGPNVLLPINFCRFNKPMEQVRVDAILASQFANVPILRSPDQVTCARRTWSPPTTAAVSSTRRQAAPRP
jgi:photosynthetic reaction center H subunit